jgi:hypothetical protein
MTDTKSYPYVTHLDIKFPSLDLIDIEVLAKSVTDQWYNQTSSWWRPPRSFRRAMLRNLRPSEACNHLISVE